MARLYRPHIPLSVRLAVALRQEGFWPELVKFKVASAVKGRRVAKTLSETLSRLAEIFGCTVKDLRLDHDPPLAARPRRRKGLGKKTYYTPDANDPDHLEYRPHGAEFAGSHHIKTNVRGDHGQFPDRVLIKRERRRRQRELLEKAAGKPISLVKAATMPPRKFKAPKIKSRGFDKTKTKGFDGKVRPR